MDKKTKDDIAARLTERGATNPCPRCGNNAFTVIDGYINHTLQDELRGLVIGGRSIPTAVIACNRCGFLSLHALGALGLLPESKEPGHGK